ncbi:MAG: acyl transferase [Flaviaesturariibacter sp.]|nr:acyl transferase [Flaviaesturariibacter sp.]
MDNADIRKIFDTRATGFEEQAITVFQFQYLHNPLYREFVDLVSGKKTVNSLAQIPFLPISFFKSHVIKTTMFEPDLHFKSSGTTGSITSNHWVKDASLYATSCEKAFEKLYGPIKDYCILALLPSYLEQGSSSLVYMVQHFMDKSQHPLNGFYLHDGVKLAATIQQLETARQKTLLMGVTYALLDFAEAFTMPLQHTLVMETGGMKGRKKELLRSEVHQMLKEAFSMDEIHSEYGMTELLSQAYAQKEGRFITPPWMKVGVGEEDDPGAIKFSADTALTGVLHVIDLANVYSCSFIATQDIGRLHPDGSFEVLGRLDHSDIRGCSLLAL